MALGPKRQSESIADRICALANLCFAEVVPQPSYGDPFYDWYLQLSDRIIKITYNYDGDSQNVTVSVKSDQLYCWTHYEFKYKDAYYSDWFENHFTQTIKSFTTLGS